MLKKYEESKEMDTFLDNIIKNSRTILYHAFCIYKNVGTQKIQGIKKFCGLRRVNLIHYFV